MALTTWNNLISAEMQAQNETWADVVHTTLNMQELNVKFNAGFGGSYGAAFTLWTVTRVYFPVGYDGKSWVGSVPRNPSDETSDFCTVV